MLPLSSLLLLQDEKEGQAVHPRVDEAKGHLRGTCLMSQWGAERDAMLPCEEIRILLGARLLANSFLTCPRFSPPAR